MLRSYTLIRQVTNFLRRTGVVWRLPRLLFREILFIYARPPPDFGLARAILKGEEGRTDIARKERRRTFALLSNKC